MTILERRVICASAGVFLLLIWVVGYYAPTINDQLQRYHALPRAQQGKVEYQNIVLDYHVVVIDGAEYLVVTQPNQPGWAVCPKAPKD